MSTHIMFLQRNKKKILCGYLFLSAAISQGEKGKDPYNFHRCLKHYSKQQQMTL